MPIELSRLPSQLGPNFFVDFGKAVSEATDGKTDEQLELERKAGEEILGRLQAAIDGNREVRAALAAEVTGETALAALDEEHAKLVRQHGEVAFLAAMLTVVLDRRRKAAETPSEQG